MSNTGETLPYGLGGDRNVLRSDVARLFIEAFVLGDEPLPVNQILEARR